MATLSAFADHSGQDAYLDVSLMLHAQAEWVPTRPAGSSDPKKSEPKTSGPSGPVDWGKDTPSPGHRGPTNGRAAVGQLLCRDELDPGFQAGAAICGGCSTSASVTPGPDRIDFT